MNNNEHNIAENNVPNNGEINDDITLEISYNQNKIKYKCKITDILENYVKKYTNENNLKYENIYVIYNGNVLLGEQLKKPIFTIISSINKEDRVMPLMIEISKFNSVEENEIIIILSIESVKIIELKGDRKEKIKNLIKDSIEFDFKWCIFKYREKEIDIEQKFDNIVNDEEKKIVIDVNYTIPVIVCFEDEQKNKQKIQCLLGDFIGDKIKPYFGKNHFDSDYYYLIYKNKKIDSFYYEKFYEIITEDKIKDSLANINIYNNTKLFTSSDNLEKTNTTTINDKEKIIVLPFNATNEEKIKIKLKIIKKCCCVRLKIKISKCCSNCCYYCSYKCRCKCCEYINRIMIFTCCLFIFIFIIILSILSFNIFVK